MHIYLFVVFYFKVGDDVAKVDLRHKNEKYLSKSFALT